MATQFVDRKSTYPNRYKITRADGSSEYVTLERADSPTVAGTPLNAATFNNMQSGFSETGHGHAASDITSGTFSTARIPNISMSKGGTGATSGWEGLKNLLGNGPMVLKEGTEYQYGDTLPSPGTKGRIFFLKKGV
jgi:hypothetical protein